jgi:DNA helicase-2/ATP-dependent DNA helicase PcrA
VSDLHFRILDGLNPPQKEAVETLSGPLLILAGAGSGKTRVVTRRIANLIRHGVRPWEILAITFTNKAAAEMRHRVDELVGEAGVWMSTFHSFSARLLRREAGVLGYSPDFSIYDEEDAGRVIKDIVKRLGLDEDKRYSPRNVRQMISTLKSQALDARDLNESLFHERLLKQIYTEYEADLKKSQALDFDDLLRMAVTLFREHPDVLARYQDRFKHVLVDEYQDTNSCQYHLVKMLGMGRRNVCATGDPDQSIYAWRGADVRNILSFENDFPEAKVVKLEQNYRSTKLILQAASAVIANNIERKPKELWTDNPTGERVTFSNTASEETESIFVAGRIDKHVRAGARYSDCAVFYRTNSQSRPLEEALMQANIPYQIVGGTAFYERREVKDALAYLRLTVNPSDDAAFRRVINVPKRALGDTAMEMLEKEAKRRNCALLATLDGQAGEAFIGQFKPKPRQGLIQFARLIDTLRAMPAFPVTDILLKLLDKSGLKASLLEAGEQERLDNLNALVNAAANFDAEHDPAQKKAPDGPPSEPGEDDGAAEMHQRAATLSGFLENASLMAATDKFDPDADLVTLMTLHMAKGLEFPVVFLTGMEEGLLPMVRATSSHVESDNGWRDSGEDPKAVEEERRLVYVGITRAREKLHISRAQFRRRFGKSEMTLPSRFLNEIPEKLLESEDAFQSVLRAEPPVLRDTEDLAFEAFEKEAAMFSDEQEARRPPASSRRCDPALQAVVDRLLDRDAPSDDLPPFGIGDRVRHASFGVGTVEGLSGSGLSMKIKVLFRNVGPKLLLLNLAKLEKIGE